MNLFEGTTQRIRGHRGGWTTRRGWLQAGALAALALACGVRPARSQEAQRTAAALLAAMPRATTIQQGRGARLLYVFFDPNCPYCHQLYLKLRPLVAQDGLQVRWVVLGMLTASSLPKAAAILQAPDRWKAFETNENDYDFAANGQPGGGILPAARIEPATRRLLERNLRIYRDHRLFGVPITVWKTRAGEAGMLVGVPSDEQLRALIAAAA